MTGSASSPSLKRKAPPPSRPTKRRRIPAPSRSVWNSTDDWDQLVADAQLSTSSISLRRPKPRGLQSLVKCAIDSATRGFKRLWEDPAGMPVMAEGAAGEIWKENWEWVPDHLKVRVRDAVYKNWGGYLKAETLNKVFAVPPVLYLPGALLPAVGGATHLKPFWPAHMETYTTLILAHCPSASDTAIAGMIHRMPKLEVINLKGCALAGEQTINTIAKRCENLVRLNLKGTAVKEEGVKKILDTFGPSLVGFKIDDTLIENVNDTFGTTRYMSITHLCLPGDMLNVPSLDHRRRMRRVGPAQPHPPARPTPEGSNIDWSLFFVTFPAVTHLCLPRLFLPDTIFAIRENTLVKLSLGSDPPIPIKPLTTLILSQQKSLRTIHLGYITPSPRRSQTAQDTEFFTLGGLTLTECHLEEFKLRCGETKDSRALAAMRAFSSYLLDGLRGPWRKSLTHLSLDIPITIEAAHFLPEQTDDSSPALEVLDIPGAKIAETQSFVAAISHFRKLRSLDLSTTTVTDNDIFTLLDACSLISRIDLTSCRGVKVQYRRNIFKAWEESRHNVTADPLTSRERR